MGKRIFRTVSFLLVMVLLANMLPTQSFAAAETQTGMEASGTAQPVYVLGEERSLRTEDGKHFRMSDGSFMAVSYGMPVHYQDEDGAWQEIDNRMTLSASQDAYTAQNGEVAMAFCTSLQTGQVLHTSSGDTAVTMYLLDTAQSQTMTGHMSTSAGTLDTVGSALAYDRSSTAQVAAVSAPLAAVTETSETAGWTMEDITPAGLRSAVLYEDVFPGVDLSYTAYGNDIKEQIIVNTPQSAYRYDFFLRLTGVAAALNEDGSVSLVNAAGEAVYHIPAPYMVDGEGVFSDAVSYTLTAVDGGAVLTVEADSDWINAEDRVFPVAIDPTIQIEEYRKEYVKTADIYASYVIEATPNSMQGLRPEMYIGYSSANQYMMGYLYFNKMPEIPAGATVVDAQFKMRLYHFSNVAVQQLPIGMYEVTADKDAEGYSTYYGWIYYMQWKYRAASDTSNMLDYVIMSDAAEGSYHTWDMTELVKKWYATGTEKRMVALSYILQYNMSANYCAYCDFYAYSTDYPPVLTVSYRNNTGIEPYY